MLKNNNNLVKASNRCCFFGPLTTIRAISTPKATTESSAKAAESSCLFAFLLGHLGALLPGAGCALLDGNAETVLLWRRGAVGAGNRDAGLTRDLPALGARHIEALLDSLSPAGGGGDALASLAAGHCWHLEALFFWHSRASLAGGSGALLAGHTCAFGHIDGLALVAGLDDWYCDALLDGAGVALGDWEGLALLLGHTAALGLRHILALLLWNLKNKDMIHQSV